MSTKDNLLNLGLLAAGGVAIAAASGVYGHGSRNEGSKGSRATTWEPKGDGFRRTDVHPGDEVELLYVKEINMYLPRIKCAGHAFYFDEALPLAKAKTEAGEAYKVQLAYNDYIKRSRN